MKLPKLHRRKKAAAPVQSRPLNTNDLGPGVPDSKAGKNTAQNGEAEEPKRAKWRLPKFEFVGQEDPQSSEQKRALLRLWASVTSSPTFDYHLLWALIIILSMIGMLMQFSASTIMELSNGVNPYLGMARPVIILVVSFILMQLASKVKLGFYRIAAPGIFGAALICQLMILSSWGREQNGNKNWIYLPGINQVIQPSEFLKVAFVILLTWYFAKGKCQIRSFVSVWKYVLVPLLLAAGVVLIGKDMGTVLIFVAIVAAVVVIAGIPMKWLLGAGILLGGAGCFLVLISASRRRRVASFFSGGASDPQGIGLQPTRAKWGLGTGGLTGIGPGASRQKWNYLPEAHTDFIFAILGEEFGLLGTLCVLFLFTSLAWVLIRLIIRSKNIDTRMCATGVAGWILTQAAINIMVVIGFLPVIGIPLPLISSGGSAQMATLIMMGVLLAHVKNEPQVAQTLSRRGAMFKKSFAVHGIGRKKR